ncbi:MAG: glycosyltransferase [Candidatus Bathyarchaeota archaeon]|nr:glycosyltransferase [Candidatus Bathyarchaeota archaeon]
MKKLRIAMLSVHSCPNKQPGGKDTGGMNVYVKELAKDIGRKGNLVDVYTRAHDPEENGIIRFGSNSRLIHIKSGDITELDKLTIYRYLNNFAENMIKFIETHKLQYDLIHSHYWMSGYVGDLIQNRMEIPHITMFHTLGSVKNAIGIGETEPDFRIRAEKDLVRKCHKIIASTEAEKEQLVHHYDAIPEVISVIPCGVNLRLFKSIDKRIARQELQLNDETNIILFVGRIVPLKGIENLVRAMTYLKDNKFKLFIVGGDDYSYHEVNRLKKLSRHLHLEDSVIFLSSMDQKILTYYYSAADVCVIPSYFESFGLIALESLACGTPVVATDVGCMKSVIQELKTGYILNDNAPRNLADRISELLSRSNLNANSIRESIIKFNWSNISKAILKEYRSTLECANPKPFQTIDLSSIP